VGATIIRLKVVSQEEAAVRRRQRRGGEVRGRRKLPGRRRGLEIAGCAVRWEVDGTMDRWDPTTFNDCNGGEYQAAQEQHLEAALKDRPPVAQRIYLSP
jgi:hypothetical protein